jgi:mono/diheme cytochrome c family protein
MRGVTRALCGALAVTSVVVLSAAGLTAQSAGPVAVPAEAKKMKNPVPSTPASIEAGSQLFTKYCRFCHGNTGKADSAMAPKTMKPSNLADATWDRGSSDGEIFWVIQNGAPPKYEMKGLKGKVSDPDIWNIVNFVRTLGGAAKSH